MKCLCLLICFRLSATSRSPPKPPSPKVTVAKPPHNRRLETPARSLGRRTSCLLLYIDHLDRRHAYLRKSKCRRLLS